MRSIHTFAIITVTSAAAIVLFAAGSASTASSHAATTSPTTQPAVMQPDAPQPAASQSSQFRWSGKAVDGSALNVPAEGRVSVLVYVMAEQPRSARAMADVAGIAEGAGSMQAVAVVSGRGAEEGARQLANGETWKHAVVVDADYEASGAAHVHVWPTTLIIAADGRLVGRIAGLPASFAGKVQAYSEFAAGQINADALAERLASHDVVQSTNEDAAARHLEVAMRLMRAVRFTEATAEVERGLRLKPGDTMLQLLLAKLKVLTNHPAEAIAVLEALDSRSTPAWRIQVIRGRALVDLGRWEEAQAALEEALRLNPDPAEAYYFLGKVHEQKKQWEAAAGAYRKAFESAPAAQPLGVDGHGSAD